MKTQPNMLDAMRNAMRETLENAEANAFENPAPWVYKNARKVCDCGVWMAKTYFARHKREACPNRWSVSLRRRGASGSEWRQLQQCNDSNNDNDNDSDPSVNQLIQLPIRVCVNLCDWLCPFNIPTGQRCFRAVSLRVLIMWHIWRDRWTNRRVKRLSSKGGSQNMLVDHLFQYRISPWPKTAEKRGFCTCITDIRTDRRTDGPTDGQTLL